MKDTNEVNVLDELNKGTCMGMDAIELIIESVQDKNLKKALKNQYDKYANVNSKISKIYPKYSPKKPHETNAINKVMTWYGIKLNIMKDDSSSKIAEIILQGTNMGIIEGRKLLNHKDTSKNINELIEEYVDMQEEAVEVLKQFL